MRITDGRLKNISADLGINAPIVKGLDVAVRNCWHFCTDGQAIDVLFKDEEDFRYGMNLIFVMFKQFKVVILAFSLMDTHIHFILYGEFDECNRMMHEYLRRLSIYIRHKYGERKKLRKCPLSHQLIDTVFYLKAAICYTLKNAPVGGLHYSAVDYPWSSGPLYFRTITGWSRPVWYDSLTDEIIYGRSVRRLFHTQDIKKEKSLIVKMIDGLVFPGEYVAYEIVEKIFRSHKGFNYFMCISKDSDVESRGGAISNLTMPIQEMRQHKAEICQRLFGVSSIKTLDTAKRLLLARTLKSKFNSSTKQICRLCGLVYDEVKGMFFGL